MLALQEDVWLWGTLFMFLIWWAFFARRFSHDFSLGERLLAAFMCSACQIVATTIILGSFRVLYWWPLGIFNFLVSLFIFLLSVRSRGGIPFRHELASAFRAVWNLACSSSGVLVFMLIAVLLSAWVIYLGQLLPPIGYDVWGYHFLWAANVRQNGHIGYENMSDPMIGVYPWNTDILFLWWILGARTERWADIAQAPFAFVAALACYRTARNAGVRPRDAAIAGLLVFSVPTVISQMWVAYVDLAVMGAGLTALAFLSRKNLTRAALAVAGASAGFVIGTKGTGAYLLAGLLLLLLYRLAPLGFDGLRTCGSGRLKAGVSALLWFGVFVFLFGSYFYIRNWIHFGNPLGIYNVQIGPWLLFRGEIDPTTNFGRQQFYGPLYDALHSRGWMKVWLDGFFDPQSVFVFDHRIGGWGPGWTVFMLPAIPIAFIWAILRRKWAVPAILLACIIPYLLFKWDHTNTRYHLQLVAAGTTAFGFILTALRRSIWRRALIGTAGAMFLMIAFIAPNGIVKPELIGQLRQRPYRDRDRFVVFDSWGDQRFAQAIRMSVAPGTTIAYTSGLPEHKNLGFWNTAFSNRAVQVPWEDDGESWLGRLRAEGADTVYIAPGSEALSFAASRPQDFELLYAGAKGGVYRLREEETDGQ